MRSSFLVIGWVSLNKMSTIITVTSGKGGVGKTTTAINLGTALNQFGKDVIIVDANLTTPNVGLHLGAPLVPVTLNHVLLGKAKIEDALYEHESGTKVLPSSLSVKELKALDHKKLTGLSKKLKKMADYVIYDCAAGLGDEASASLEAADDIVIVTNPEIPAVTDALKTARLADELGKHVKGIIVTRANRTKSEMTLESIQDMLELPILGVIPEDIAASEALVKKDAMIHTHPKSKASRAYKKTAAGLSGTKYEDERSFWEKIFG